MEKRLRPREAEPFVAVQIAASETVEAAPPAPAVPSAPIEIRLSRSHSLLVGLNFEAAHLLRLLRVLEQEP